MKRAILALSGFSMLAACSSAHPNTVSSVQCPVKFAFAPHPAGDGVIIKLLSQSEAMSLLSQTQATVGRPIDSAYLNNTRAIVRAPDGKNSTVLIPYSMTANIGDHIAFQSAYLSRPPLCNYVPNLATRKTG